MNWPIVLETEFVEPIISSKSQGPRSALDWILQKMQSFSRHTMNFSVNPPAIGLFECLIHCFEDSSPGSGSQRVSAVIPLSRFSNSLIFSVP